MRTGVVRRPRKSASHDVAVHDTRVDAKWRQLCLQLGLQARTHTRVHMWAHSTAQCMAGAAAALSTAGTIASLACAQIPRPCLPAASQGLLRPTWLTACQLLLPGRRR